MKKLLLLFIPIICFGQPNKTGLDSVTLRNNILFNWSKGVSTERGSVIQTGGTSTLTYDPVYGSYFSIASGNGRKGPGRWNVVIGEDAGDSITNNANYNTLLGKDAGKNIKTGSDNFFAGWDAGYNTISGSANIGFPQDALYNNVRGSNNVALGRGSQYSNIAGNHNIAAGWQSLYYLNGGEENVALGGYAGAFLLKGSGNVYIGAYAGEHNDAAVGKMINNSIYIGRYTGLSSANSNVTMIGYNVQSTKDNEMNIDNIIKGDKVTGDVQVKSITISERQITFDDTFMYVKTSTGIVKKVPLQELSTARQTQPTSQSIPIYSTNGQLIGFGMIKPYQQAYK